MCPWLQEQVVDLACTPSKHCISQNTIYAYCVGTTASQPLPEIAALFRHEGKPASSMIPNFPLVHCMHNPEAAAVHAYMQPGQGITAYIRVVAWKPGQADQGSHAKGAVHTRKAPQSFALPESRPGHITHAVHPLLCFAADLQVAASCVCNIRLTACAN